MNNFQFCAFCNETCRFLDAVIKQGRFAGNFVVVFSFSRIRPKLDFRCQPVTSNTASQKKKMGCLLRCLQINGCSFVGARIRSKGGIISSFLRLR